MARCAQDLRALCTPLSVLPEGTASRPPPSFLPEPDLRGEPISVARTLTPLFKTPAGGRQGRGTGRRTGGSCHAVWRCTWPRPRRREGPRSRWRDQGTGQPRRRREPARSRARRPAASEMEGLIPVFRKAYVRVSSGQRPPLLEMRPAKSARTTARAQRLR
jgi:hypothetical protein